MNRWCCVFLSRAPFLKTATDTTQSLEGLCIVMPDAEDVTANCGYKPQ